MKILAFTVRRPWVFADPLETIGTNAVTISAESINKKTKRYVHILREGRHKLKTFDPDILLVDGPDLLGLLVMLFSIWYHIPLIVRLGGNPQLGRREEILRLRVENKSMLKILLVHFRTVVDRIVLSFADGFITVSKSLKEDIHQQTDLPDERIAVVHYPPKPEVTADSNSDTSETLSDHGTLTLTVTNLSYHGKFEGICRILEDIEGILLDHDDAAYVIAGGGSYHDRLEDFIDEQIEDSSVRNRIYTPGFVSDINELYIRADIMAYVSFIDAYPNVILEAQTAQLPVVANADHGIVEQIDDGKTGILIDPSHETELKEAIEHLIEHPDERTRLGMNAARRVREENRVEKIGEQMFESVSSIYESIK